MSGNAKEPFGADSVSITSSFRNALYHLVDTGNPSHDTMDAIYELLGYHCEKLRGAKRLTGNALIPFTQF